jgi:electron transport protein HydN
LRADQFSPFVQSDAEKCIGCRTCEIACAVSHNGSKISTAGAAPGVFIPRLFVIVTEDLSAPVQCHHCVDAPCLNVCQMSAISRVNGRTVVDTGRCVGCKLCLMACPFGAIEFVPLPAGTRPIYPGDTAKPEEWARRRFYRANNCDLCVHRTQGPACVETCPEKALELVNPAVETSRRNTDAALDLLLQFESNMGV